MYAMPDFAVEPIRFTSAAELVAERLRHLIVTGVVESGEPLRETQLAQRLEISRSSLREGVRLLEQSRLVRYEMHRGAIVRTPSIDDLTDLFRARRHLELAAVRAEPDDARLRRLAQTWERLRETAEGPGAGPAAEPIAAADLALRQAIVALLRSERLSAFYETLGKELVFSLTVLSRGGEEAGDEPLPPEPAAERGGAIVEAILDRRPADAERLLLHHNDETERRLLRRLASRTAPAHDGGIRP